MGHATTMHAHSTGSYSLSLMLHAGIVMVALLSAYFFQDAAKPRSSEIIELVAGEGDNYMATEAPAPGTPDAISFDPALSIPQLPPRPVAEPIPQPIETPIAPAAITPDTLIVPKAPPKTPPKKTAEQPKAQTKPMSKADFDKLYASKNKSAPSQKAPPAKPAKTIVAPQIKGKGILGGVAGGTGSAAGAGGRALSTAERDQMDAYLALLVQRIKEAHEKPDGVSNELVTRVEYQVSASGSIGAVRIIRSSGNRAFDDSVLKAFRSVRSIGARPDGRSSAFTADFRMKEED